MFVLVRNCAGCRSSTARVCLQCLHLIDVGIVTILAPPAFSVHVLPQHELVQFAMLPLQRCGSVCYSHGGAHLAAVGRNGAITIYPAYYGGGSGHTAGLHPPPHSHRRPAGTEPSVTRTTAATTAGAAGSGAGLNLRPLRTLKGHATGVSDMVFSADDRHLISCGIGGAVYFWDVSTGARLLELEVVDKRSMYVAAAHKDRAGSAIVRTLDGRLQQLQVHTASHSRLLLLQLPCAAVHHAALRMHMYNGVTIRSCACHPVCSSHAGWPRCF